MRVNVDQAINFDLFRRRDSVFVGSVEKFCGLEKDVMIVCPAAQNDIEQFLYSAITRAKHSVIICGDFSKINVSVDILRTAI